MLAITTYGAGRWSSLRCGAALTIAATRATGGAAARRMRGLAFGVVFFFATAGFFVFPAGLPAFQDAVVVFEAGAATEGGAVTGAGVVGAGGITDGGTVGTGGWSAAPRRGMVTVTTL